MKFHPIGVGLNHANTRTDIHDEANNRFSQYCEIPSNRHNSYHLCLHWYTAAAVRKYRNVNNYALKTHNEGRYKASSPPLCLLF
jgi:hypothetical protein